MSVIAAAAFVPGDSYLSSFVVDPSRLAWEPDQKAAWSDAQCTLLAAMAWNTPESVGELQPVLDHETGVALVADCRLDNRDDLAGRLEYSRRTLSDCDLIIQAWLRWGEACVNHLLGDFAFALWDPRERILFSARDPFGCRSLYYTRIGKGVLAASDPDILLRHPAVDTAIDEQWLAESLACISGSGLDTPFKAVKQLPGGHTLTVREGSISERRYWRLQAGTLAGLGTERAIIEEGRHLLSAAVACRLRSAWPVGAELTGGIDSAAIVATALPILRGKGEDLAVFSRLRAVSHSFLGPDESGSVISLCDHLGIQKRFVSTCTGPGLLEQSRRVLDRYAVPLCPWSIFSEEMRALAAGQGIRTMLSGFAGDNCFSAGEPLLPATETGLRQWRWTWKHHRNLARRHGHESVIKPVARTAIDVLGLRLSRFQTAPQHAAETLGLQMSMAAPEFRTALWQKCQDEDRRFDALEDDRRLRLLQNRQLHFRIASGALLASQFKQVWTYPLLDRRIVEFALACPPHIRTAEGWTRRLARLIIEDRVPASVVWKRKGRETIPGAREQVLDNGEAVRSQLGQWRQHPVISRIFDLDQAIDASQAPAAGTAESWVAKPCGVVNVLQLGGFLERHPEAAMQAAQALSNAALPAPAIHNRQATLANS